VATEHLTISGADGSALSQIGVAVGDEPGEPDEIRGCRTGGGKDGGDVRECLAALRDDPARHDLHGCGIPANLAGDEDLTPLGGDGV